MLEGEEKSKVKSNPKTQVPTTNLGQPPCFFDLRMCEHFLVRLKGKSEKRSNPKTPGSNDELEAPSALF